MRDSVFNPRRWIATAKYHFHRAKGERILKRRYAEVHGGELDLANPKTFSEKLYCRMIDVNRFGDERMTRLSDKFRVRAYVEERVGASYLVRLLWHGTDPHAIPFDDLPSSYMIKTNHGSCQCIPVHDEADRGDIARKLSAWLGENYYFCARERQYFDIAPRILVEEMLDDGQPDGPLDYRFWCFDGRVEMIQVDNRSYTINPFYSPDWQRIPGSYRAQGRDAEVERPRNLDEMIRIASRLSEDIDFVRVDLYNLKGRIVFGEMTFTPMAGFRKFSPESWESDVGAMWRFRSRSAEQGQARR